MSSSFFMGLPYLCNMHKNRAIKFLCGWHIKNSARLGFERAANAPANKNINLNFGMCLIFIWKMKQKKRMKPEFFFESRFQLIMLPYLSNWCGSVSSSSMPHFSQWKVVSLNLSWKLGKVTSTHWCLPHSGHTVQTRPVCFSLMFCSPFFILNFESERGLCPLSFGI